VLSVCLIFRFAVIPVIDGSRCWGTCWSGSSGGRCWYL